MAIEITDTVSREDLVRIIRNLEDENASLTDDVDKLQKEVSEKEDEIADLALAPEQLARLEEAADVYAELGRIHNTPHAKRQWIEGA